MYKKVILLILIMHNVVFAYTFAVRDKAYLNICISEVYNKEIKVNAQQAKAQENLYYEMLGQSWFSKRLSNARNNPKKIYKNIIAFPTEIVKMVCKNILIKHPKEKYFSDAYSQELFDMIKN